MVAISLVGVPFYTLAQNSGVGLSVRALRDDGIDRVLNERYSSFMDFGDVTLPTLTVDDGPANLKNYSHFLACTDALFDASQKLENGGMIFYLGGECSLILGSAAGQREHLAGQPGVLWIDAHGDFNTPQTTRSGFIGGMPLAFACGRGPQFSPAIERRRPVVREDLVVHLGGRDFDPLESDALKASQIRLYPPTDIHERGVRNVADEIASSLANRSDWIICHLDVDAIDPTIIPAVNFPSQKGLRLEDIHEVVRTLAGTGKLKVFNLVGYNASLDKDGASRKIILDLIAGLSFQ